MGKQHHKPTPDGPAAVWNTRLSATTILAKIGVTCLWCLASVACATQPDTAADAARAQNIAQDTTQATVSEAVDEQPAPRSLSSAAPQSTLSPSSRAPDEIHILSTVDQFFESLATGDIDTLDGLILDEAVTIIVYPEREGSPVRFSGTKGVVEAMRKGQLPKIEEPYWDPIILQRKTLATVWAPYEVWVNETLSHCGIDQFTLVKSYDSWKIASVAYTHEPSACSELWPDGRSQLRPDMFSKGM